MHRAIRDRMARSTFAAGIIAAHLLVAYFLIVPLRQFTSAIPSAGEAMVLLPPGEARESAAPAESPPEVEPELEKPEVVWVPAAPALEIRESADSSRQLSAGAVGSGRPDAPLDLVPPGQILNASRETPVAGGDIALRSLMREIRSADADAFDAPWLREELKRMKGALAGWGDATVIQYAGAAAGARWRAYQVRPEFRKGNVRDTVELRWDIYRVTHDRGISEWRIAIDRTGAIWAAHAGAVRP